MNCRDCRYYELQDMRQGICKRYPPSVFPVPQAGKVVGTMQVGLQSFFPPVMGDGVCGEWSGKISS
jgi:hypothetical protein